MIRVLLTEDEPPIMRANVAAIESLNSEFKVVTTAINGKKAIEELEKQKIDVVFTDVRMPVMDGLELVNHIKNNYPHIITVITSGYSDFEYARKAIEFKVYDYILKPVSKVKLSELLDNIQKEISNRNHEKKRNMLIHGSVNADSELADLECIVILACAGAISFYGNEPAMTFWNKVSLDEIVLGILEEGEGHILLHGNTMAERIIIIELIKTDSMERISEKIFDALKNDEGITITLNCIMGIKMSETGEAIRKLRDDMMRRIILTKSQIMYYNNSSENYITLTYSTEQVEYIIKSLNVGEYKKAKKCILEIFKVMEENNATQEDITNFLEMMINYYYFRVKSVSKKFSVVKKEIYSTISNFKNYEGIADEVVSVLLNIRGVELEQPVKQPKFINNIEEYIKMNYQNNITNTVLSKQFGFVPSYISYQFKKYKGVSPGDYLTNYRIEKAKTIMQEDSDLLVKEIADMVGFHDAYYFSKTFKRKTGIWPTEYNGN